MGKFTLVFLLVLIDSFIWFQVFKSDTIASEDEPKINIIVAQKDNQVLSTNAALTPSPLPTPKPTAATSGLEEAVQKSLDGTKGKYAVVIKNLKTGEIYNLNEDEVYEAASLYKLWVMGLTYKEVQSGNLKEDQTLSQNIATLNSKFGISPEYAEQTEGGITLTVTNALKQMITISHNYAALLLTEKLKASSLKSYVVEIGLKKSETGTVSDNPQTTASDTALFLEKLYKGQLANEENTGKMINLLKDQKKNNKLPKNLPINVVIGHKTGEIGRYSHDGGIVYTPKGDYIIVVMSESSSPKGAEERIADISQAVYEYFTK